MKVKRKIIEIDEELCNGCGQCVLACAEGAIQIIDGKAKVISDNLCDGLGACIGDCPEDALKIIERDAEEYDEVAVEKHLAKEKEPPVMACGCPSTHIQTFAPASSCEQANIPASIEDARSTLTHWPVQIRLVPAHAPFLKGADLLILADCCAVAYPRLHNDLLNDKVVMMGCPKFDDIDAYVEKFADIFKTSNIRSITAVVMEVPCCSGLPMIIKKGMELAGKEIPVEKIVISTRGEILNQALTRIA
ncbi:MAG: 4Fe-4S ferredoxin [Desulfobacteraceae bacterium 4572_123]|nr:MAG: 4Fe-4S ferredoxin [Desulfobacteraceae bacterium 4572_123]